MIFKLMSKYLFFTLLVIFWGCRKEKEGKSKLKNIFVAKGVACWYGSEFEGKKTSNGEIFRSNNLTAAHRALEFGTLIRVTNLQNQKSVVVKVNDRGPFVKNRLLDLSEKAAKEIDMLSKGYENVSIEIFGYEQIYFETLFKHYKNIQFVKKQKVTDVQ